MPENAETKKTVRIKRTTTVTFEEEQVKDMIRKAAKAPANAEVKFDDAYFYEATVEWSEEQDENEPAK